MVNTNTRYISDDNVLVLLPSSTYLQNLKRAANIFQNHILQELSYCNIFLCVCSVSKSNIKKVI